MPTKHPHQTPLAKWLRLATKDQRERAEILSGVSVNYLYQIAGMRREPLAEMAFRIEDAMRTLHRESGGVLPIVTARDLAESKALTGLTEGT